MKKFLFLSTFALALALLAGGCSGGAKTKRGRRAGAGGAGIHNQCAGAN